MRHLAVHWRVLVTACGLVLAPLSTAWAQSAAAPAPPASLPNPATGASAAPPVQPSPGLPGQPGTEASPDPSSGGEDGEDQDSESVEEPPPTAAATAFDERIQAARARAKKLTERVWMLRGKSVLTKSRADAHESEINSITSMLAFFAERSAIVSGWTNGRDPALAGAAAREQPALDKQVGSAERALQAISDQLDEVESKTGWSLVAMLLRARCATAICFDNGDKKDWLGIEPLVELPIGKSFALSNSSLSSYTNNHDLRVDLAAGVRVWFFRDVVSLSLYISKPLTDAPIRVEGAPFVYPAASIRRPYPGIALGALFDSIWLGFDRDELRNGDGQDVSALNPAFPPNEVVASSWTLTVALQPVTAFRTAIGTGVQATRKESR